MDAHLIVKLGGIGDVVMALPAVKHFKEKAGGEIHWMCGAAVAPLIELFPFVDRVFVVNDQVLLGGSSLRRTQEIIRAWKLLPGARYRTCAVLQYDWRYAVLTLPVLAERRILLSRSGRSRHLIPGRYHGDEYARILLGEDGLSASRLPPLRINTQLPPPALLRTARRRIAVIPGGARNAIRDDPQRRWPLSHYAELSTRLLARGCEVLIIGGPADHDVIATFSGLPVIDLIGRLELTEVLSLFETCDLVVSHDTGPLHLAALTSAAVLALFGPVNPNERLPNRANIRHIWGGRTLACRPCYDGRDFPLCLDNRCMKEILPVSVMKIAEEMLGIAAPGNIQKLHEILV